jgi:TolB protein
MNVEGSGLVRVTRSAARDDSPAWSPDGRRIAFVSDRDGNADIQVVDANASGLRNLTRTGGRTKARLSGRPPPGSK